jgi:hypothetical protein
MRSNRMLMGAAVIGCLAATMTSGAYPQEVNGGRTRQQLSTGAQPDASMRQRQSSVQFTAGSTRPGRSLVEEHRVRGERPYTHISADRYSRSRRTDRELYARAGVEGGYGGERRTYRDRAVGADVALAATDYGYRRRPLYATYAAGYTAAPFYNYAPGYDLAVTTGPYYTPSYNVAYNPYYDYAPGVSVGIGIGPVGIGVGPAWGW